MHMEKQDGPRHHAYVASHTPGRLRIKMHPGSRTPDVLQGIQRGLQAKHGVRDVRVNAANGSVTVIYDHLIHNSASMLGLLDDLDVVIDSIGKASAFEDSPGAAAASPSFLDAVEDINARIRSGLSIPFDLKLILPLTFAGAGAWSIAKEGLMIESVPGWLFLWLAFDMFVKLHPHPAHMSHQFGAD